MPFDLQSFNSLNQRNSKDRVILRFPLFGPYVLELRFLYNVAQSKPIHQITAMITGLSRSCPNLAISYTLVCP